MAADMASSPGLPSQGRGAPSPRGTPLTPTVEESSDPFQSDIDPFITPNRHKQSTSTQQAGAVKSGRPSAAMIESSHQRGFVRSRPGRLSEPSQMDVSPKVSRFGQQLRQGVPHTITCGMFCGGKSCKYESAAQWPSDAQALKGVFSHWVNKRILAMARPNSQMVKEYDLLGQFQRNDIKAIINLQELGEHAHCGPSLHDSGYSYDPQAFMDANIFFYPFGWKDFGTPPMRTIFNMVKVMDFALQQGKIAVHCHAGLGRTGMLIACYLVYGQCYTADQAISLVREKRPGSIQTDNQLKTVRSFASYIRRHRTVFTSVSKDPSTRHTAAEHLVNERFLQHGMELRRKQSVPKIVTRICELILQHAQKACDEQTTAGVPSLHRTPSPMKSNYLGSMPLSSPDRSEFGVSPLPPLSSKGSKGLSATPQHAAPGSLRVQRLSQSGGHVTLNNISNIPTTSSPFLTPSRVPNLKAPQISIDDFSPLSPVSPTGSVFNRLATSTSDIPGRITHDAPQDRSMVKSRSSEQLFASSHVAHGNSLSRLDRIGDANTDPTSTPITVTPRSRKSGLRVSPPSQSSLLPLCPIRPARSDNNLALAPTQQPGVREVVVVLSGQDGAVDKAAEGRAVTIMTSVNSSIKWKLLESESDPRVLWMLLCHWLYSLKDPLLNAWLTKSGEVDGTERATVADELVHTCGEVNAAIVSAILDMVEQVHGLSSSLNKAFLLDKTLGCLGSVLTQVSKSCDVLASGSLKPVTMTTDRDGQKAKQFLQKIMKERKG